MLEKLIGSKEPSFYVSFALYFEKYERNFKKAEETYRLGLQQTKDQSASQDIIIQKFKEFGERMVKRIQRDITPSVDPADKKF